MKIKKLWPPAAPLIALLMASTACMTAPRRTSLLLPPAQAHAPALTPVDPVAPAVDPAPQTSPQVLPPEPKPDPVAQLIAEVEKEYQAGQDNYKAGHPDAGKQNFDHAVDLLLKGPLDVRSDARLQAELDRVLEGANDLEAELSQKADDSAEQKTQPAPIDEANEVTVPAAPGVKAQAEAEVKLTHSDLPLMMTDQVAGYITYFSTRGRATLENALIRSGRYREMIRRVLKSEGVPQDLIYLAQAESGFHPLAVSRAGARGMWQFMGSRAKAYGLERNRWMDDRQDPEKSTRAAARHLKDLYNQFGDWYLAMAAYNSGPVRVQNAVKRTGYADFWQLYKRNVLPRETRNYVPIIVAVTIMAKNPAQYGLDDLAVEKPLPYETVKIDYAVDLRLVAECVNASVSDVQELNPSLLRLTTPKDGEFELHLPPGTKNQYLSAIADIPPDMRPWWRYHTVASGDTLVSLARANRITPRAIAEVNDLEASAVLESGSKLIIPIAPGKHAAGEDTGSYSRRLTRYKVRKGDTVQSVADTFGVPPAMVRRWNHLKNNSVQGHRVLYVRLPVTPNLSETPRTVTSKSKSGKRLQVVSEKSTTRHTVKSGETLTSIASTHHTTVAALKRDNGDPTILRPGMILIIRDGR